MANEVEIEQVQQVIEIVERGPQGPQATLDEPTIAELLTILGLDVLGNETVPVVDEEGKFIDKGIKVDEQGSLLVNLSGIFHGESHLVKASGENLVVINKTDNGAYHSVWQSFGEGNTAVVRVRDPELPPIEISAKTQILTNPQWTQGATSGNQTVKSITLDFAEAATRVVFQLRLNGKIAFSVIIPSVGVGEVEVPIDGGIDFKAGQLIDASITSLDGDVKLWGDEFPASSGNFVPYNRGVISLWTDKEIALAEDGGKPIAIRSSWKATTTTPIYQLCNFSDIPQPITLSHHTVTDDDNRITVDNNGVVTFNETVYEPILSINMQVVRSVGGNPPEVTWGLGLETFVLGQWIPVDDSTIYMTLKREDDDQVIHVNRTLVDKVIPAGSIFRMVQACSDTSKNVGLISTKPFANMPIAAGAVISIAGRTL